MWALSAMVMDSYRFVLLYCSPTPLCSSRYLVIYMRCAFQKELEKQNIYLSYTLTDGCGVLTVNVYKTPRLCAVTISSEEDTLVDNKVDEANDSEDCF